jgi:protein SCO1/2
VGGAGLTILYHWVNPLTMWLTLATFIGYAIIYTVLLKPATPQNIVIGGASGAMPPVLGWAAVTGEVSSDALLLFLIIFAWTPPHFWALALYRTQEYAKAGLPMLPVTHGAEYTRLQVLSLHHHPVCRHAAAVCLAHERLDLPRVGDHSRRHVHRVRVASDAQLLRRTGEAHVPVFALSPVVAVRGTAGRSLHPAMNRRLFVTALLAAALAGCGPSGPAFRSIDVTGADYGRGFKLTDHNGQPRTLADYKGKLVTLFFGFTHCPDVCPTSLSTMKQALTLLGPDAAKVQVLFITVDPERDTADFWLNYVPKFDPSFIGLRGDLGEPRRRRPRNTRSSTRRLPAAAEGQYTMDHSAGTYVHDTQGRLRLFIRHGETAENIAQDLKALLAAG